MNRIILRVCATEAHGLWSETADLGLVFTVMTEALFPNDFRQIYNVADSCRLEFESLCQETASIYTILFISKVYFDLVSGYQERREQGGTVTYLAKSLRLLQNRLEDPIRATDDSTISIIMSLARAATVAGDSASARVHMQGLHKVLTLRGGIASLGDLHLQVKCLRLATYPSLEG